jgi:hypothetical protein
MTSRNQFGLCIIASSLACSSAGKWVQPLQDEKRPLVHYLTFTGMNATGFTAPDGSSCQAHALNPQGHGMLGWEAKDNSDPACSHDTNYEGVSVAALEMHWRGKIPRDGSYELNTFGYTVHTTGEVVVRGSWNLDTWAVTNLTIEMKSDHCSMEWSKPVASATARGPWMRKTPFYGYQEIPPLQMDDCKAGDILEVTARLAADVNRGRVDVDSFGFLTGSASDAKELVALVPKSERLPPQHKEATACASWTGAFCSTSYEKHY